MPVGSRCIRETIAPRRRISTRRWLSHVRPAIASHNLRSIAHAIASAEAKGVPPAGVEFQMLHGIRRDLQQSLVKDGWRVRVYIPFGTEWYPYLMRRLAERPANVLFIAKNMLRR